MNALATCGGVGQQEVWQPAAAPDYQFHHEKNRRWAATMEVRPWAGSFRWIVFEGRFFMLEFTPLPEDVQWAHVRAAEVGVLNGSITENQRCPYGLTFQKSFIRMMGHLPSDTFDWDSVDPVTRSTHDEKGKFTRCRPLPYFTATVANFNTRQRCDFYQFGRVAEDFRTAWYVGWLPKAQFRALAKPAKLNELDPADPRGWKHKADCWNVEISQLMMPMIPKTYW
jgi:hypothetical protein